MPVRMFSRYIAIDYKENCLWILDMYILLIHKIKKIHIAAKLIWRFFTQEVYILTAYTWGSLLLHANSVNNYLCRMQANAKSTDVLRLENGLVYTTDVIIVAYTLCLHT